MVRTLNFKLIFSINRVSAIDYIGGVGAFSFV